MSVDRGKTVVAGVKPRLMHLFNSFEVGGVERQHMMLVERLASHYEQICWSFFHGPIEGELDALGVTYSTGDFSVLRSMLEQNEFDCAIIRTNRFSREVAAYFTASPTPVVYIRSFLRWYEGNDTHFDEAFEKLSYAYPDHIFFSGPSLRDSALRLGMHIPGGEVLYNGVDMSRFSATPRVPSFSGRPFRVGMLANIAPHKNQLAAIEALKPELESGGCTLIMGGEEQYPDYARQVRNAARNLPVEFLGYVARPETFFADVDVLLLASTREGWPTVLMEAMAAGLPCIAPDIGDISRLLGNGEFGMLYADGDFACIPRLVARLRRVEHYVHYAKQAHLRGLDFDIERTSRTLHRAIQGVMAKVNAYAIC